MTPAIGGTGREGGMGQPPRAGGPGAPGGPGAGQAPPPGMVDQSAMAGAAGVDAQQQLTTQVAMAIRPIGEQIKALADLVPMAADDLQQIQQLLKQVLIKAAQGAPTQTPSGMAVPGNGGGM